MNAFQQEGLIYTLFISHLISSGDRHFSLSAFVGPDDEMRKKSFILLIFQHDSLVSFSQFPFLLLYSLSFSLLFLKSFFFSNTGIFLVLPFLFNFLFFQIKVCFQPPLSKVVLFQDTDLFLPNKSLVPMELCQVEST